MAYTGTSIVDYLSSTGKPSDFASRASLAASKGIQNYTGTVEQNTQLLGMLNVPTTTPTSTTPTTQPITSPTSFAPTVEAPLGSAAYTNKLLGGQYFDPTTGKQTQAFTPTPPPSTPPTTGIPSTTPAPTLPVAGANLAANYFIGASDQVAKDREALKTAYDSQIKDIQAKINASQAKVDSYNAQQVGILGNVQTLTSPFQADLEKQQEQALYVKQNFEENQKLTNELDSLLTQGNNLLKQQEGQTGLASILDPRIADTMSDITARAGVIQAVMSARNNQISVAYTMIDRAVAATNADRNSQLNYYQSLSTYYSGLSTTEQAKITTLTTANKTYVDSQISMLQDNLKSSQATADAIKAAMINPQTALTYAKAGVTLNDTVDQINQKLATYAYTEEVRTTANNMATNGYQAVTADQAVGKDPRDLVTITDSAGNKQQYWKATSKFSLTKDAAGNLIKLNTLTGEWETVGSSGVDTTQATTTPPATDSQSILAQTGLSIQAFNYLTQGTSTMSRMTSAQRNQIMRESTNWLNKQGIDVSTFQSQYKAYNDVLTSNIERFNKTKIMENEVLSTADNLTAVATAKDLGSLKWGNVAKLFAGEQFNDPLVTKYSFHLEQMRNELAGFYAASQGKSSPDVIDNQDAANTIKSGLNSKSIAGFKDAVENATKKMSTVLNTSVNAARKSVWDLFGVGGKFKPTDVTGGTTSTSGDISSMDSSTFLNSININQ